jgi:hypothetical protein
VYGWFCLVAQITLGIHVLQKELSLIVPCIEDADACRSYSDVDRNELRSNALHVNDACTAEFRKTNGLDLQCIRKSRYTSRA